MATLLAKRTLGDYAHVGIEAFLFCKELMEDPTVEKSVRLSAAKEVMDRLWGKTKQQVEHSGSVSVVDTILKSSEDAERTAKDA